MWQGSFKRTTAELHSIILKTLHVWLNSVTSAPHLKQIQQILISNSIVMPLMEFLALSDWNFVQHLCKLLLHYVGRRVSKLKRQGCNLQRTDKSSGLVTTNPEHLWQIWCSGDLWRTMTGQKHEPNQWQQCRIFAHAKRKSKGLLPLSEETWVNLSMLLYCRWLSRPWPFPWVIVNYPA